MMLGRAKILGALLAVGVLQTSVLAYMVGDRVLLLSRGREIVLPIVPVDPRDLFRGQYVRLSYPISRLETKLLEGEPPAANASFYVTLQQDIHGVWSPERITATRPTETSPDRIVLAARGQAARPFDATISSNVRYGIESYFVPEADAPALEKLARDKKMAAIIAVDSRGNAAIKGLVIDGQRVYSETLF
jgi:uncharacterized membrane-anchored protein